MATTQFVSPLLPTIAGDASIQPLVGTDLWLLHKIDNLHIIPTLLDIPKFTSAVKQALSLFPILAGRIRHDIDLGTWWVDLTNSPIPVVLDPDCDTPAPPAEWVVLSTVSPFIEPLDTVGFVNQDLPVLTIKLSLLPAKNQSVIGISISHIVADAYQTLQFTRALSDFYQGLQPTPPPSHALEVLPPLDDPLEASNGDDWFNRRQLDFETAAKLYQHDAETSTQVNLHIRPEQSEALKRFAISGLTASSVGFLSTQDALSAYLIYNFNRVLPEEERIQTVLNVTNYREALAKVNPSLISVCGFILVPTSLPTLNPTVDMASNLAFTAAAIRHSLELFKNPATITREIARTSMALTKHANEDKTFVVYLEKGRALINSNARYEWTSPHFGFAGRTTFHTTPTVSRFARIFRSNPIVSGFEDGQKVVDDRKGWLDIQLRVPKGLEEEFMVTFKKGLEEVMKASR